MDSSEELNCLNPVGAFVAYFSIPQEDQDWPYSQVCHFPGGRIIWMRPVEKESRMTSIYLIHAHDGLPNLRRANAAGDRLKQKEAFAELYDNLS